MVIVAVVALAACGGDDTGVNTGSASGPSGPVVTRTTTGALSASTSTPTVTPTEPPTTAPPTSTTTTPAPTAAEAALDGFLEHVDAVMALAAKVWPFFDKARAAGASDAPDEAYGIVHDVRDGFYGLPDLVPHGLDPAVRAAAVKVIYDVGKHLAPFIFAPGFTFADWNPAWDSARTSGEADEPVDRAALVDLARQIGDVHAVAATSQEAAEDAALFVVVVRSFGLDFKPALLPYSLRWLGVLPEPTPGTDPPFLDCANVPSSGGSFTGTFVEGVGGCAMLYHDTTDPSTHDAELAAFLADPQGSSGPPGEIITVQWYAETKNFGAHGSSE